MSGNTSNTSNDDTRTSGALKSLRTTSAFVMVAFELFVLAEILWYYLHDGEQTLHEAASDYLHGLRVRAEHRVSVVQTRNMIRDLPETDSA